MTKKVIIIGLGVAGQTAALSLTKHDPEITITIYEKSNHVLSPIGAGIGLTGGARCLTELGYRHVWEDISAPMGTSYAVSPGGSKSKTNLIDALKGTSMEGHFVVTKRDDLLLALHKELVAIPSISIKLGKTATSFKEEGDKAIVCFSDGTTDQADIVICADGIHSMGKNYIIEDKNLQPPEHSGLCVYYSVITKLDDKYPNGTSYEMELGSGAMALILPLRNREAVLVVGHEATEKWNSNNQDWTFPVTVEQFNQMFVDLNFYKTQDIITEEMVKSVNRLSHLGIYQQQNLPHWHKGRIVMIGDAAHATSPFMGQGANQAMQDSYLIGKLLAEHGDDHEAAFRELFTIRHPVTEKIVSTSKSLGHIRTGTSLKHRLMRVGMRTFAHLAPNSILQKLIMTNLEPTFLKPTKK